MAEGAARVVMVSTQSRHADTVCHNTSGRDLYAQVYSERTVLRLQCIAMKTKI